MLVFRELALYQMDCRADPTSAKRGLTRRSRCDESTNKIRKRYGNGWRKNTPRFETWRLTRRYLWVLFELSEIDALNSRRPRDEKFVSYTDLLPVPDDSIAA